MKKFVIFVIVVAAVAAYISKTSGPSSAPANSSSSEITAASPVTEQPPANKPEAGTREPTGVTGTTGTAEGGSSATAPVDENSLRDDRPPDTHNDLGAKATSATSANNPPPASMAPMGLRMKAKWDGPVHGCKEGALTLNASTFTFACSSKKKPDLTVMASDIKRIDSNGVELNSGAKYHFDIPARSSIEIGDMFWDWHNKAPNVPPIARR